MDIGDIRKYLEPDMLKISEIVEKALKSNIGLLNIMNQKILSHSGKKIRPMLALLAARAGSGGVLSEDTLRFAVASELLHNATLLHDDVADNSLKRRGTPNVLSILGGRASVLIGDYWLVKAMDMILNADRDDNHIIRLFSKTLKDLAEGEMLQLEKASLCDTEEKDYLDIIYKKTASLFETTAVSAALSVGAEEYALSAIKEYSINLGLAFQVKDDIFDYKSDLSIGKEVGQDLKERKITLPLLGALNSVSKEEAALWRKKVELIDTKPEYQGEIVDFVNKYQGVEYANFKLNELVSKAVLALEALPDSKDKDFLKDLAKFVAEREL